MLHHDRRPERPKPAGEERKTGKEERKETRIANAKKKDDN